MVDFRGKFEWLPITYRSIVRNKRRSFAMISGIILGTVILSGIFIYSSTLNERNFETVVENAAYEVRFDLLDNETMDNLSQLKAIVESDARANGAAIIASHDDSTSVEVKLDKAGTGEDSAFDNVQISGPGGIAPIYVENDFSSSAIGQKILTETTFEGSFDINSGNSTVVSRSIASRYQLQVNDVVQQLNITYTTFTASGSVTTKQGSLKNVEIKGIFEKKTGNGGFFEELLGQQEMYFSFDLMHNYLSEINNWIIEEQNHYLAVKIEESQFSLSDPEELVTEISTYINDISNIAEENGFEVTGNNVIEELLVPYQITSIFVTIFDILLAAPVVILSLYLLIFGLEMSLEERRRQIAIKKVQGADSSQIYAEIRNEAIILFIIGVSIGYLGGIFGAWIISSSIGFMQIEFEGLQNFIDFFTIDRTALIWSAIIVGGITTIQIIRRGKSFVRQEVSEQIQRYEEKQEGLIRRAKIDIIMFVIGVLGVIISILEQGLGYDLQLNFLLSFLINGLGPFFLWIGGAIVGARLSKAVPLKFEKVILSLSVFKDISRIIRSGLRRRGDTDRLAIIIILTLSIATLAAAQGSTDESHSIRTTEWEIGSDFQINFATPSDYTQNLTAISGVENVMAMGVSPTIRISSSYFSLYGINAQKEHSLFQQQKNIGIWHEDSFSDLSPEEGLKKLVENPEGLFVTSNVLSVLRLSVDELVDLKIDAKINETHSQIREISDVKILGVYDHIPGNIRGPSLISSHSLLQKIQAVYNNLDENAYSNVPVNASRYLVKLVDGEDLSETEINNIQSEFTQIQNYVSSTSLQKELRNLESSSGAFGIPGLLTMNFVVSVAASLISTFAFSAILMERRKQEFAVLRSIGAKRSQIYKIAIGENILLVTTSVLWGTLIGIGITYQFNGVFEVFGIFLGGGPLNRIVIFPWITVIMIGLFTSIGILFSTILSVRGAAKQDLSIATRVI